MKRLLAYILIFFSTLLIAQPKEIELNIKQALIGEPIEILFSYHAIGGNKLPAFNVGDTLTSAIEILEVGKLEFDGKMAYEQKVYVTAWDSGYYVVPPISVGTHETQPYLLRFNTIKIDPQGDIKPIKPQMNTPFIFDEIKNLVLIGLLIIVLLVAGIILAIYFYRKNKKKNTPEPIVPPRPPMEILWERFNSLKESKIWEQGEEKAFHVELSLILRTFLEFKHKVKALDETTSNITKQLDSLGTDRVFKDEVKHILNFSDMVKFAKQKGVFSQHENALDILKRILETHQEANNE